MDIPPVNKKLLLTTALLVSFFVVSLGFRIPYLDGNPGPKPRPRAVIKSLTTASQQFVKKLNCDMEAARTPSIAVTDAAFFVTHSEIRTVSSRIIPLAFSRAPPFSLS